MTRCWRCSAEPPSGAAFCTACGSALSDHDPPSAPGRSPSPPSTTYADDPRPFEPECPGEDPPKRSFLWLRWLLFWAAMVLVAAFMWAILEGRHSPNDEVGTMAPAVDSLPYDPNGFGQLSLAMDLSNPSTLYAGTTTGLFKSSDGAGSWKRLSGVGGGVHLVVIDPAPPPSVYVWTDLIHLFRSDDGGATWTDLSDDGLPMILGSPAGMWLDTTSTPSALYMHGARTKPEEMLGTWQSTDRGETWTLLTKGEAAQASTGQQGRNLPPAAQEALDAFLASFGGTITDAETGAVVRRVPPGDGPVPVIVDPAQPSILYLVMYQGVYKSTDAGRTWRKASTGLVP